MKIKNIVSCVDDNPVYFSFWKIWAKMWQKFGYKVHLGYLSNNPDKKIIKEMNKYTDMVYVFPLIEGIPPGNQSKMTRGFICSTLKEQTCMIVDIDAFMLNIQEIKSWYDKVEDENTLVIVGANGYVGTPHEGKFPMQYTAGKGTIFNKLLNPDNLLYYELMKSWIDIKGIDGKEQINKPLYHFSDESLYRYLISTRNIPVTSIHRADIIHFRCQRRIDRSSWLNIQQEHLKHGYYIDCQPIRPYNSQDTTIREIIKYLGIDDEK